MTALRTLAQHACFGGVQSFYEHDSSVIGLPMRFGVYLPPQAQNGPVPALFFLAGLTCNEETFAFKAGAQRVAAELGLAIITPDTSPRGAGVAGESDSWDFGVGAGFYLDATQAPWAAHWKMGSYVARELFDLITAEFPIAPNRIGISGHSMGGHGALTLALKHPERFRSASALAPICAPTQCPWGEKAFSGYVGTDRAQWESHDATALIQAGRRIGPLLIDQGEADKFLAEQLHPHLLEAACQAAGQALTLRRHAGYDHGYFFVSTFIADHLHHHARGLSATL